MSHSEDISIIVNGNRWNSELILNDATLTTTENEEQVLSFCRWWLSNQQSLILPTSGSTGAPKEITITRNQLIVSAMSTGKALGLSRGTKTLCCLPVKYIAGKMMLVRAFVLGLDLEVVEPSMNPQLEHYQFTALVPAQFSKAYSQSPEQFKGYQHILLGGAPVSYEIEVLAQQIIANIYHTYGMTETVSHIALRKLNNGKDNYFKVLDGITISQDERNCLVVEGEVTNNEKLITNDVVRLISQREFEWLGRADNVINSGGLKIHPEQVEEKIKSSIGLKLNLPAFYLTSEQDSILGNRLVMVIEGTKTDLKLQVEQALIKSNIDKILVPKAFYLTERIEKTPTGKIVRKTPSELVNNKSLR